MICIMAARAVLKIYMMENNARAAAPDAELLVLVRHQVAVPLLVEGKLAPAFILCRIELSVSIIISMHMS